MPQLYKTGETYVCPHFHPADGPHETIYEEMPDGYATERWLGAREEVPYLRCPVCTATFPVWGIREYIKTH